MVYVQIVKKRKNKTPVLTAGNPLLKQEVVFKHHKEK